MPDIGEQIDPGERLSHDDMATRTEHQFLEAALRRQRQTAGLLSSRPGRCANCGERCIPRAVYCDHGCRDDHERQLRAFVRNGTGA